MNDENAFNNLHLLHHKVIAYLKLSSTRILMWNLIHY